MLIILYFRLSPYIVYVKWQFVDMEFPFNVNAVLRDRITILRGGKRKELIPSIEQKYGEELARIVNEMGVASSKVDF